MSKSNFFVDPDFPVIDASGHPDVLDFTRVKGGGSTNTTYLDDVPNKHVARRYLQDFQPLNTGTSGGSFNGCSLDTAYGCLNNIIQGDNLEQRCSDRVLLDRVVVNGLLRRPAGFELTLGIDQYPPKAFICLVADLHTSGAVIDWDKVFIDFSSVDVSNVPFAGVPFLKCSGNNDRYRVLAFDVVDFARDAGVGFNSVILPRQVVTGGGPLPVGTVSDTTSWDYYHWFPAISRGFTFDVDLNSVLCSFKANDGFVTDIVDISLHMFGCLFDGSSVMGYSPSPFGLVDVTWCADLFFTDFLSPTLFNPAGVDGGVVADEAPDLIVLADQSASLAGLPALPDSPIRRPRKKTKASEGYYNFRPSGGDGMLFPDDPEVAALAAPGSRGSDYGRRRKAARSDRYEKPYGDEFERPLRRGKY